MNRKSEVTVKHFMREYHRLSGSTSTILGFERKGIIYMMKVNTIPSKILGIAHESSEKGGHFKVRIAWHVADKDAYIKKGIATPVMTVEEFLALPYSKNKGFKFEGYVANCHIEENQDWKPSNDPFDKCGDVVINGEQIQVKFENASLTNIQALHNAQDRRRKKVA